MVLRKKSRRGIVILIVLSLLVLFVVLAVTFAIVAGQYRRAAEAQGKQEQSGVPPERQDDNAIYQLLRDTPMRGSVVRGHSLLLDLNGGDGFKGNLADGATQLAYNTGTKVPLNTSSQLFDVIVDTTLPILGIDGSAFAPSQTAGYYNGCVLSITSGKAKGLSTRITGYQYDTNITRPVFRLLALKADNGQQLQLTDFGGASFVVNGRPFNGTGVGYNAATGKLDQADSQKTAAGIQMWSGTQLALLPNYASLTPIEFKSVLIGGNDEPYDAPDFQNMFLAMVPPSATASSHIIPSFHRPELVNYWMNNANWANDDFKRRVVMRPVETNFDGSNPNFAYVIPNGDTVHCWDVDNDGDSIPDSIWVDLGMPIQTAPDGRKYKPLFAILCVDLDGRLNVNAHGNPAWLGGGYGNSPQAATVIGGTTQTVSPDTATTGLTYLPKGQGYGPPEIRLDAVVGSAFLSNLYAARYGNSATDMKPGLPGVFDPLARIKLFEEPQNYFAGRSSFASPGDLQGELAVGVDYFGQPNYETYANGLAETRADSPYDMNLNKPTTADTPFTIYELERLLRRYDVDASLLPNRLAGIGNLATGNNARGITTISSHLPVFGLGVPAELRKTGNLPYHITDILTTRLRKANAGATQAWINAQLALMLPPELVGGTRMDINRPLGNGRDDNGNNLADEMGEQVNEAVWTPQNQGPAGVLTQFQNIPMNHLNGLPGNPMLARQLYARYLYVMMLTLLDWDSLGGNQPLVARMVAQWAINVVDFRDADSIMTPFEYDKNPFNGWDVDGDLTTTGEPDRDVVWGCERPELLLMETLAFHDRRTEDRDDDDGIKTLTTDASKPDPDFDQRLRPHGSLFIELYNPWTSTTDWAPAELYRNNGVDLAKVATDGNVASAVWRLQITDTANNPDRQVYFVDPTASGVPFSPGISDVNHDYWPSKAMPVQPVSAGAYAVVGSRGYKINNEFVTPVGRVSTVTKADETTDWNGLQINSTRRIVLSPFAGGNQVHIYSNNVTAAQYDVKPQPADADILPATAVVVDSPRSLSISEPRVGDAGDYPLLDVTTGYQVPKTGADPSEYDAYNQVRDKPFDNARLPTDGTTPAYRIVNLQRLANPLIPWNATTNPYLTIDTMRCDLTVFNGVAASSGPGVNVAKTAFYAVQRGDIDFTQNNQTFSKWRWLWPQEPLSVPPPTVDSTKESVLNPPVTHYFGFALRSTLGCLNHEYWDYLKAGAGAYRGAPDWSNTNSNNNTLNNTKTFPWLVWNNRPFVSPYELLQVPAKSCDQLLRFNDYTNRSFFTFPAADDLTNAMTLSGPDSRRTIDNGAWLKNSPYAYDPPTRFGHLFNFFSASQDKNYYRLLDYVQVPSRFAGAELEFNPQFFQLDPAKGGNPLAGTEGFLAPFNHLSEFRDPGRVNINTIFDQVIWDAIRDRFGGPTFSDLVDSRRGYGAAGSGAYLMDPTYPSRFANPFRGGSNGLLAPITTMERKDVETTLLRSKAINPNDSEDVPLFDAGWTNTPAIGNRDSYFRYQLLHRLGNMVTTNSNVYAVWITVGYFEATNRDANGNVLPVDAFHPDGYRVGQEMGRDTGEVKRHRAFYIIDRSIPVAFEPGENHNVDRCILLRRYIE